MILSYQFLELRQVLSILNSLFFLVAVGFFLGLAWSILVSEKEHRNE